jgi:hypothetical protein
MWYFYFLLAFCGKYVEQLQPYFAAIGSKVGQKMREISQ